MRRVCTEGKSVVTFSAVIVCVVVVAGVVGDIVTGLEVENFEGGTGVSGSWGRSRKRGKRGVGTRSASAGGRVVQGEVGR